MITLPSYIAIADATGLKFRPLDEDDFSTVFHEYIHYLQNIATPSGFHSFRSAFDIWRLFRETVLGDGTSTGSTSLPPQKEMWLNRYLDLIFAIDGETEPDWPEWLDPDTLEIDDIAVMKEQRWLGDIVTAVIQEQDGGDDVIGRDILLSSSNNSRARAGERRTSPAILRIRLLLDSFRRRRL